MEEFEKTTKKLRTEIADLKEDFNKRCMVCARDKQGFEHAVKKLHQRELKYSTIFENVQDVYYQTDLNRIIYEISPSIKYYSDFSSEELVGRPVSELYSNPEERNLLLESLSQHGEVRDYEIRLKTGGGKIKYASINARLVCDDAGKPMHIDGALRDITARKVAEEAIVEREKELNYAQQIAKMGSWKLDLRTGINSWSENMYHMVGYTDTSTAISYNIFLDMVHPEDKHLIELGMQEISSTGREVRFDFRHILSNGEIKWFKNYVVPVYFEDELIELHGVNIDITDSKLLEMELIKAKEQAEASDRLKTAFMNNISHEVRTPLNAIQGFAPMIIDPRIGFEEKQEMVELLNFSVSRLIQTITDYMDISLITSGTMDLKRNEFALDRITSELRHHFEARCNEKSLLLTFDVADEIGSAKITSDRNLLLKVLSHLLDNAIKFTTSGEVTLGISLKSSNYEFYVRDTGKGIGTENLSAIFKHFVQEDESSSRPFEGSGLGLSIVRSLVGLLGGTITVESVRGKGSTFSFTLPV